MKGNETLLRTLKDFDWVETLIFSNEWEEYDEGTKQWVKHTSPNSPVRLSITLKRKGFAVCDRYAKGELTALN